MQTPNYSGRDCKCKSLAMYYTVTALDTLAMHYRFDDVFGQLTRHCALCMLYSANILVFLYMYRDSDLAIVSGKNISAHLERGKGGGRVYKERLRIGIFIVTENL